MGFRPGLRDAYLWSPPSGIVPLDDGYLFGTKSGLLKPLWRRRVGLYAEAEVRLWKGCTVAECVRPVKPELRSADAWFVQSSTPGCPTTGYSPENFCGASGVGRYGGIREMGNGRRGHR